VHRWCRAAAPAESSPAPSLRASERRVAVATQDSALCQADETLTQAIDDFKIKAQDAYYASRREERAP